ncbi:MAG: class I SAM-dependent methyltransferase [candidate division Zixibacteria bacterium]|nr:class I SAM-dependent methyltransferase [candidate division Zixibacteria bacterium]
MATVKDVHDFWNRNLCGDEYTESQYLSIEYFEESKGIRYRYHYHIPRELGKLKDIKKNGKALEIGLGLGVDTQVLCELGYEVTGVDLTEKSVEATSARLAFYGLPATIMVGNAEALGFDDETFDIVYSFGVLHHTPDTQKAVNEVYRVLKKGGVALIMLYHRHALNYLAHLVTFTQFDGRREDPCPVERAYSRQEARQLFKDYSRTEISVDYLFGTGWGRINYFVPMGIKKLLGKYMGWHLMIKAVK